jgi:regulator of sigma E protease
MAALWNFLHTAGIILLVLLVFNFVILVHEWGHFLAARWRGLKVEKFQIWMGQPIWKRTWNGVQYGLGWLPIGGFVQLPQMSPMEAIEGASLEPREKLPPIRPLDKIIVAFAGPLFSMLLAVACAFLVSLVGRPVDQRETSTVIGIIDPEGAAARDGQLKLGDRVLAIDGQPVKRFLGMVDSVQWFIMSGTRNPIALTILRDGETEPRQLAIPAPPEVMKEFREWESRSWWQRLSGRPPVRKLGIGPATDGRIAGLYPASPAERAGLKPGDRILRINGEKVWTQAAIEDAAEKSTGPLEVTVLRGSTEQTLSITPEVPATAPASIAGQKRVGISKIESADGTAYTIEHPAPFGLIRDYVRNFFGTISAVGNRSSSIGIGHMSGPVGIMNLYYRIFQHPEGWRFLIFMSVIINVSLALFNLLPVPVLDGGHITMAIAEWIRGRPLPLRMLEALQTGCVLLLLTFVGFVTIKDVSGLREDADDATPITFRNPDSQ